MPRRPAPAALLCAVVMTVQAGPAMAQTLARPAPAVAATAAASTPLGITPSPRLLRDAANPMRVILEASKIRRKPGDVDVPGSVPTAVASVASAADPKAPLRRRSSLRTVASGAEPLPIAVPTVVDIVQPPSAATTGTAAVAPSISNLPPPAVLASPAAPAASAPAPLAAAQALPVAATTTTSLLAGAGPAEASSPAAAPAAPAAGARPRIISMVAPEFPANVLRRVGSFSEITVQLTIQRDGSVSNVSVPSAALRALEPYVVDALQQWRFEAPGEPRSQRLQLVFNN